MKKILSFLLISMLVLSLCACGEDKDTKDKKDGTEAVTAPDRATIVENTPLIREHELFDDIDKGLASAKDKYNGKQFKISLRVINVKDDTFELITTYNNSERHIKVYLEDGEIDKIKNDKYVTVLGTFSFTDKNVAIKDAFLSESYEKVKKFSPSVVQEAIDKYATDTDGSIDWKEESFQFFIKNRANFELLTEDNFLDAAEGEWTSRDYLDSDERIMVFREGAADVTTGSITKEWKYSFSGKTFNFPADKGVKYVEARKVSDNLIVFYDDSNNLVPKLIIFR